VSLDGTVHRMPGISPGGVSITITWLALFTVIIESVNNGVSDLPVPHTGFRSCIAVANAGHHHIVHSISASFSSRVA
jgi:hypothetical protein